MPTVFSNHEGTRYHVSAWRDECTFNLSDSTGDHSTKTAKFRKLPEGLRNAIKSSMAEARQQLRDQIAAEERSLAAIAAVWRPDMIRYDTDNKDRKPCYLIERTLAGINAAYAKDCAETPYYQDHQFGKAGTAHHYDTRLSCYYGILVDGGIVMDIHDVLDARPSLSIASPLLDTHRKTVDRFAERMAGADPWILGVFADPLSFGNLATLAQKALEVPELQSFDYAPLSLWCDWWKQRGARFGQRQGNRIVWTDGTAEDIRPEADRWKAGA